ncbi:unnamed protein product [Boreogadus saida]
MTMLTRVKSAVTHFMGGMIATGANGDHLSGSDLPLKFPYMRPEFLGLSPDEIECSADHSARPILILKESKRLPWSTGYAEVINAGKSSLNEDQACCEVLTVKPKPPASGAGANRTPTSRRRSSLPNSEGLGLQESLEVCEGLTLHYWGLFDGHAGSGAAVAASLQLHGHVAQHLQEVLDILRLPGQPPPTCMGEEPLNHHHHHPHHQQHLTATAQRSLTRAASLRGAAGAPAGTSGTPPPQTRFFTEKKVSHESLVVGALENAFKDMSERVLCALSPKYGALNMCCSSSCRAYKSIEEDDLKFPLIYGEGKKARVLATIGVTRGLGDHDLKVHDSNIYIKPFLSCCPEVKVYPLTLFDHGADDVLVLGTDGLWDVLSNQEVAEAVTGFLANCDPDDQHRYTMAAQDLVMRARGMLKDRSWRISGDRLGSGDDISVYLIPLMYGNTQT